MTIYIEIGLYIIVGALIGYILTNAIMDTIESGRDKYRDLDVEIKFNEYYKANKPEEQEKRKHEIAENRRLENVKRNIERDNRTNKTNADGFNDSHSENED